MTLRCAVTGSPTPKITWKKDDLLVNNEIFFFDISILFVVD